MGRITHKRRAAAAGIAALLLLGGGGLAYAYFTTSGSGSGPAPVAEGPGAGASLAITTPGPDTPLTPGGGAQAFDVSVQNTGTVDTGVDTVSMSVMTDSDNGDAETPDGTDIAGCSASWFSVTPSLDVDHSVGVGDTVTASGLDLTLPTISMTDSGTDQDACEGSSVGIGFSSDS